MANIVTVAGRTVRPAEVTRKGESVVARFTLATNSYRGKKKEESAPTYIDFVAFGKQAEFAEKFLDKKGAPIVVSRGHLRSDSYKNKEGETVYTTNVVADEFEFASCDLNKVLLIGRLTRDPEIRWTKSGQPLAIARFTLAVDRKISKERKDAGEQSADFINIKAFGATAEWLEKWTGKGTKLVVDGSYNKDIYDGKDGKKHAYIEVIAQQINFAETKAEAEGKSGDEAPGETPTEIKKADAKTAVSKKASAPAASANTWYDVSEDENPFANVAENTSASAKADSESESAFVPKGSDSCPFDFGAMFGT